MSARFGATIAALMYLCYSTVNVAARTESNDPAELMRLNLAAMLSKEAECLQNVREAQTKLKAATTNPYRSKDDRRKTLGDLAKARDVQTACVRKIQGEIEQALNELEIQCQNDVERLTARHTPSSEINLKKSCAAWARSQRLAREEMYRQTAVETDCLARARDLDLSAEVARERGYERGRSGSYKEQQEDRLFFEREKSRYLECASKAAAKRIELERIVMSPARGSRARSDEADTSGIDERSARDIAFVLQAMQNIISRLGTGDYYQFASMMNAFEKDFNTFKAKYGTSGKDSAQHRAIIANLVSAGDQLFTSEATWRRELSAAQSVAWHQKELERARDEHVKRQSLTNKVAAEAYESNLAFAVTTRDALVAERARQWQTAREFVSEASVLAASK